MKIRGGIAVEGEHFVPAKNIIALAIGQEISVLDSPQADGAGDFAALRLRKVGTFIRNDLESAFFGFVEEISEFHNFAGAGFERLAIFAKHRAEWGAIRARAEKLDKVSTRGEARISALAQSAATV